MAASLVTDYQSAEDILQTGFSVGEPVIDQMFQPGQDADFAALGVDFDLCPDLQLDGVDFPLDIWSTEQSSQEDSLKLEESFGIDEDFNQMLNEWDNQLDSLQNTEVEDILQTSVSSINDRIEDQPEPVQQQQQTVTLKKPNTTNTYRGVITSNQSRQIQISSALRSPIVTRGVCYTRTGGLGVTRSVQSSGFVNSCPRVSISNQLTGSSRQIGEDSPLLCTPLSPIRSPGSSNAPDFFIASTRSTADVVKSSYSRLINQCRTSIISTNPDSAQSRYSENKNNSHVKIIASVSPKSDGTSTAKILSSNSIRESLPKELIDKIRAASQGRKTIAIIEPINRKNDSSQNIDSSGFRGKQTSKFGTAAATLGKWRNVGILPSYSNNVSDHDYCCPSKTSKFSRKYLNAHNKVMRQMEESMNRSKGVARVESPIEEVETKKDSGLESCEMSDASEDGTMYDKLPRYLTSVSVQTMESRSVQDDHGYNRLPAYLIRPQQSLLKTNISKSVGGDQKIVVSSMDSFDFKPDISDTKPEYNLVDNASQYMKIETPGDDGAYCKPEIYISDERTRIVVPASEKVENSVDKTHLKRRRDSFESSSDETDNSYRSLYKRRRSNYPRELRHSSRDRRRRYRGRSRSCSSSPDRSSSRSGRRMRDSNRDHERSGRHYDPRDQDRSRRHSNPRERTHERRQNPEHKSEVEERRVIYVGGIVEGTLKSDLRTRFETFGPIVDISVHFRERGDNYGFLTFQNSADAYTAIERGNENPSHPKYDLCFGGRRTFCKEDYYDMDDVEGEDGTGGAPGFDELLRRARKEFRK